MRFLFPSLYRKLDFIIQQQRAIMTTVNQAFNDLKAELKKQTSQIASLRAYTTGIKAKLDTALAGVDMTEEQQASYNEVFHGLEQNEQDIAAMMNENTPAAEVDPNAPGAPPATPNAPGPTP